MKHFDFFIFLVPAFLHIFFQISQHTQLQTFNSHERRRPPLHEISLMHRSRERTQLWAFDIFASPDCTRADPMSLGFRKNLHLVLNLCSEATDVGSRSPQPNHESAQRQIQILCHSFPSAIKSNESTGTRHTHVPC